MSRAVVLLSGGLDSATVLAIARADGYEPWCISFDYGQRHAVELDASRSVACAADAEHIVVAIPDLGAFGGSALTDGSEPPKHDSADELDSTDIAPTYVPGRNTIFLAFAMSYAETIGADDIYIGVNVLDYSGYPDCRPEFVAAFGAMANLATARGVTGHELEIHAPLIDLTKSEIIARGLALGVDYSLTHSCYDPVLVDEIIETPGGDAVRRTSVACGRCDSCLLRLKGFAENGVSDPIRYTQLA